MSCRTHHELAVPPGARSPARDARAWRLAWLVIGSVVAVAACSPPRSPGSVTDSDSAPGAELPAGAAETGSPATPEPGDAAPRSRRGGVSSDELVGLGELGLLPALFQTFGADVGCDFDDALSTCQ